MKEKDGIFRLLLPIGNFSAKPRMAAKEKKPFEYLIDQIRSFKKSKKLAKKFEKGGVFTLKIDFEF